MTGNAMRCLKGLVVAGGLVVASAPLGAQERDPASARWSASASGGISLGQTTKDIEAAMRASGWGDVDPGGCRLFCAPARAYPSSQENGAGFQLMLTRQWRGPVQLRAALSSTNLGTTIGFQQRPLATDGDYLEVQQRLTSLGVLAGASALRNIVWVAAGPAVYRATLTRIDDARASDESDAAIRVGGLAAIGLDLPLSFPVLLQFQGQYRFVGSPELGPIRENPVPEHPTPRELPRTAINFNHALLLMGLGLRF